jgi:GT2 family glycosyltransferase
MTDLSKYKVSYIIVNFKSSEYIHQIISKLINVSSSIYIVDCSNDYSRIKNENVVKTKQNIGFGNAINLAVSQLKQNPEFLFFINPDVIFKIEDVEKMILSLSNKDYGAVVPISIGSNSSFKTSVFRSDIGVFEEIKMSFSSYKRSLVNDKLNANNDSIQVIEFIDASFCLVKYKCFTDSGGFPKNIFMYGEDLVLSDRLKKIGYKIILNKKLLIIHPGGATFGGSILMKLKRLLYSSTGAGKAISIIRNDKLTFFYVLSFLIILLVRKLLMNKSEIKIIDVKKDSKK